MTVKELIEELQKHPEEAEVKRQMTAEWGAVEVEQVRVEPNGTIIID